MMNMKNPMYLRLAFVLALCMMVTGCDMGTKVLQIQMMALTTGANYKIEYTYLNGSKEITRIIENTKPVTEAFRAGSFVRCKVTQLADSGMLQVILREGMSAAEPVWKSEELTTAGAIAEYVAPEN